MQGLKARVSTTPEIVLADAGDWHQQQMENIVDRGIRVLVPPDSSRRKGKRPGWDGGAYAVMRRVLATEVGGALYRKRQWMIEPVSATPSSTAEATASYAAAEPPAGPNGV